MAQSLPLSTLLSACLVAFTIEFDNEAEHRMPHRTATYGPSDPAQPTAPWLVSQAMWANVMQYVDESGLGVDELQARSGTAYLQLPGLTRWGYLTVSADTVPVVRATAAGRRAQEVWQPLADEVEQRWEARFGAAAVAGLRAALRGILSRLDVALPAYLPITSPTQNGKVDAPRALAPGEPPDVDGDVSVLLARVLLACTLAVERQARLSLPICANTLRVLDADGVRVRDLPTRSGVSKEAQAMSVGFLARRECVVVEPDPTASRGQRVRLTPRGERARVSYVRNLARAEAEWSTTYGAQQLAALRETLERLVGPEPVAGNSPLFAGLTPYPDGWRAKARAPVTLPHHPMVLHRGGYPDGS